MLTLMSFLRGPGATGGVRSPGTPQTYSYIVTNAGARIAAKPTLPPTGVHAEAAMQITAVLLAVGTTLLLIRRKRRDVR
jgi:uncharacterized surface anchored protein